MTCSLDAALWANHIHGAAGELCAAARSLPGSLAQEVLDQVPAAMRALGA